MGATRLIFGIAALFNFVIAAALLLAPAGFLDALGVGATADALLIGRMFGIPVASFGVGYLFVAARPAANRDLIRLGIIGKSALIVFSLIACATEAMPWSAFPPAAGDIVFVALFAWCLRRVDA